MEVSKAHRFVWIIGAVFVFVPRFSMGLLSDYKICGDPECESLMSRVQAIKDYHGKDCRFLTFRRGDTIFVYHKLTGKRDDIWAGTIDKQFGYFPKDAVREEQVYATTEKVVETQKSDFFCMDESGYPIDTSYLDSVDDDHQKLQTQESETMQMSPNTHATNSEGHSASAEPSTESKVEAKEAEEVTNLRDAAEPNEKTSAAQEEQGGSPSSAWLGSSVTGWLGFSNEEQSDNLDKGDKDESTETKADTSVSSSVTGWLSFGGETKTDDTKEIVIPKEDSFTSTMTGWLGFGGEKQTGSPKDEQNEEEGTDKETEPTETFRSRRMSLDLEGSESEEEEKEEIGTLGWLGSGLSSRLGFGQNKQDLGHGPTSGGEGDEEKEQTKSWMDIGIGGILGLGEDKSKESEVENDKIIKQTAGSDRSSGSQASLTHEVKVETSNELQTPTHVPVTEPVRADNYEFIDSSVRRENSILDAEAELKVEDNDASLQAVAETSNSITTIKGEIDTNLKNNIKIYKDFSAEIEAEVSQISDSRKENIETTETREPEENITNTTGNNQDFKAQPKSPENNYDDVNSNFVKQFENEDDKKQMQSRMPGNVEEEEGAKITNSVHNLEEFSYLPEKSANGDDHIEEPLEVSLDLSQWQVFPTQTEDSAEERRDGAESNKQSQLLLSSFEEINDNDNVPVEGGFTPPILESNDSNSNTPAITGDNVEMEIHHGELETEAVQGSSQEIKLLYSGRKNTETLYENASEEDSGPILTNGTTTNISKTLESQQSFNDKVKEIEKETLGFQEDILSLNNLKSTLRPKIKTKEIKKTGKRENEEKTEINGDEEKNQLDVNEGNEEVEKEEEQSEAEDINEKQNMDRTLPEQEKLEEVEDSRREEKDESNENGSGEEGMESEKEQLQELKKENKQIEELEQEKQVRVEGVKESKETKEKGDTKKYKQEEGEQLEIIQSDIRRPELENNRKDNSLESLFSEIVTQTEDQMTNEIKEDVDQVENEEEEEVVGKQQMKHVEDEKLKCINQICAQDSKDAAVTEGDGHSSEDGGSSAGAAAAWIGEKKYEEMQVEEKASNNAVGGNDEQMWKTENAADEHEFYRDGELLAQTSDSVESQTQSPEQTPSENPTESSHPPGATESESKGAFGVFGNTFSFFSQTPNTGSTENVQSFNTKSAETSEPRASLTPEPELDSTTDPLQAPVMHTVPHTELLNPTSTENIHHSAPSVTETPTKTKTITKQHHNLLMYMTSDETAILLELFGRHKLQFLDYVLAGSEAVTAGDDQSILSDIERLLHHHTETLVAPSMRLTDAPQEDQKKTRTLVALQKLETLLKTIKDTFSTGISDVSKQQGEEKKEISQDSLETEDKSKRRDEQMTAGKDGVGGGAVKEKEYMDEENRDRGSKERAYQEGLKMQTSDFNHEDSNIFMWLTVQVVSSLPDDMQPGPDLYGVPWEPVIITGLVGLVTFLLFTCRCYSSIKSRMYRSKERCMSEQIAQLLDEKCKVLETLGQCQQEYDDLETSLKDGGVLAQTQKTEHLGVQARQLDCNKKELGRDLEHLKDQLDQQREHRKEQERRIAALEEYIKTFEEETKDLQSQEEQAQTTLKIYEMNSDRLQRNLETSQEENIVLQESNNQLRQQVEGWAERVSELEAEMQRCEVAHSVMLQDVANKDERIMSLTDRLLRMKDLNPDLEEDEDGGENEATNGTPGMEDGNGGVLTDAHLQKVQKLIYAAKINADLKSVDEDKDRVFAKLNDEIKAKEDLQMSIKELENEKLSLHSDSKHYSDEVERLQQKLHIMTEMYQENELKLHRMLTVEEKERLQKEEKLNKADKNIAMALEELNNYRKRAEEMEEELEKTKQSYQTQISAHEKKAHNNWLAARAAERDLGDIRRENALFRQKLTDTQFKLDSLDKDPYALNSLARPLPFRGERSPYGPSPLGRPSSETRPFLSPPTLMDGPPTRLSPRVSRGPVEPSVGQGEMERSGGPHSDSGSNSPSWERDRRGPPPGPPGHLGPPGYMFPEPGGPMFRRPPPPPAALGLLPPPGSIPPGPLPPRSLPPVLPHPADMADGSFRETRLGPGDQELRLSGPGDRRTPPESDPRMGGPPFSGPPMNPIDGPFPRRTPYGPPPPPDFYPPRGPGVHPMMPMWPPPRQGMMLPPRFPPGGPPLPPMSHPNMHPYGPPIGHPPPDGIAPSSMGPLPPQQSLAPHPHSQSPEESVPSPEDAI